MAISTQKSSNSRGSRQTNHRRLCGLRLTPLAAAALISASPGWAQTATTELKPVIVTGRANMAADVAGFGDIPLSKTPLQASTFGAEQIKDTGAQRLADLIGLDAGVSDSYNAEGYWDFLTVRGYVLDNRFNFRRDGLPISAETSIALDNKASVEILKGLSGMQAGTSAPGGLVNYVVKRPTDTPITTAMLEWRQKGTVTGSVDLSRRFGADQAFGLRINAAAAKLDPLVRSAEGERHLFALAGDWRLSKDTLIEAEVETSRRSQPSVPGFSLLGDTVPAPTDPRINLNNQPWSQPVVFEGDTASLRLKQRLTDDWRFTAHLATQRLRTDDRLAFPFGCFAPEPAPDGTYYADRYCPDGTFDLYDFRSENERRRIDAIDLSVEGKVQTGRLTHTLVAGVQHSKVQNRFQRQAYNYSGTGNIDGNAVTPAAPDLTDENTNRDERSTEFYARDALRLGDDLTLWGGLRHTRLDRQSVRTDGSRATDYEQSFTTPWLAASYNFTPGQMIYASWGRGVESEVAPNRARYTNRGEALPSLSSKQFELGIKGSNDNVEWGLAWFDIERPRFAEVGTCDGDGTCTREVDGTARHQGMEATSSVRSGPWMLRAASQWLRARTEGSSAFPENIGLQPANVPKLALRLQTTYRLTQMPGTSIQANLSHESRRMALPDNSLSIPGFTQVDASARHEMRMGATTLTWRVGIDNLFDKRAWRESPYQFDHSYLFPMEARTFRLSVQADL